MIDDWNACMRRAPRWWPPRRRHLRRPFIVYDVFRIWPQRAKCYGNSKRALCIGEMIAMIA